MIMDTDGRVYDDSNEALFHRKDLVIVDDVSDRAMTPLERKRSRMWWDLAEDLGRKKPAPTWMFYYRHDGSLMEIPIEDKGKEWREASSTITFVEPGTYLIQGEATFKVIPKLCGIAFKLERVPWYKRGLAGRLGSTRLNHGLEALLTRGVIIIAHMLGFWRDREERRLLRVELLDRNRKGRRLWTQ